MIPFAARVTRPPKRASRAAALLLACLSACADPPEPTIEIAGVPIPQTYFASLTQPQQETLSDLVAFGGAVARDETSRLGNPLVEQVAHASRIETFPFLLGATALGLNEPALRQAYLEEPEWELVVRHMVRLVDSAAPDAARDSARFIAVDVANRAHAGEDFAMLAGRFSQEPGAVDRGGLLQPGRRGSWVEPFWRAASALSPGETSGVVESPYGYHVIKLEERRPVPFEQASTAELLRRVVPIDVATAAMQEWAARSGRVSLDSAATDAAWSHLSAGTAIPDSLVIADSAAGDSYAGGDLTAGWGRLTGDERRVVEQGGEDAFRGWLEGEAREFLWAAAAAHQGVQVEESAVQAAEMEWRGRVAAMAQGFGFTPGMPVDQILSTAVDALLSGAPAARSARLELPSLRPRLRELYPASPIS